MFVVKIEDSFNVRLAVCFYDKFSDLIFNFPNNIVPAFQRGTISPKNYIHLPPQVREIITRYLLIVIFLDQEKFINNNENHPWILSKRNYIITCRKKECRI